MSKTPLRGLVAASVLAACALAQDPGALDAQITEASIRGPLSFLADDLLEGRGPGTRGDALTRLYIRTQLASYGLLPGGVEVQAEGASDEEGDAETAPTRSWDQPVPILGITSKVTTPMTVTGPSGQRITFEAPSDFTADAARPDPKTAWKNAGVVFVGYGITAPEEDWDDFGDMDLTGKVLLVMNNDPESDDELFAGKRRLYYGRWSYKYEEAARRGAVGAIVIHTTPSAGYPFQVIQSGHEREHFWLPFQDGEPTLALRSWCSEEAALRMCALGGHDLVTLRELAESRDFTPVDLGITIDMATDNEVRRIDSGNVAGVLPGSDPELKDELVVITAHFDHLGIGPEKNGDTIYNGALDNASGCAAVLNLARVCASLPEAPRRSLMFLFVTAEESGLLGSKFFAFNPTWPRRQIVADFNVDGLNIWGATEDLEMIGYGKNSLTAVAEAVAQRRGRRIEPNKQPELGLFYRSDHFSFARIGVPAAYFKAGSDFLERAPQRRRVKASYTTVRYHQPNDEFDARWRLGGAVADARLILECLLNVANADEEPTWTAGDEFEKLRDR